MRPGRRLPGNGGGRDRDDNGFISRVSPDGAVETMRKGTLIPSTCFQSEYSVETSPTRIVRRRPVSASTDQVPSTRCITDGSRVWRPVNF